MLTVQVCCAPLFPTPPNSSAMKTPENKDKNPDDPEPAYEN
jgi:hypothetical protein